MASATYEVAFRVAASTASSFSSVMKGAGGALQEINKRMGDLGKQQAANKRVVELRQGLLSANREFNAARQRVQELGAQMKRTEKPTKAMVREYKRAQTEVRRANKDLEKQREALRKVEAEAGAVGKSVATLTQEQERLAKASERAARVQGALQKNMAAQDKNLRQRAKYRGQMMDAIALGATLAVPVKQAMEWEQTLATFNKVAGKTPEEVNAISRAAQEMAVQTGVAREEIMGAYIAAAQAGFDESEWQQYAEAAAKMGVAFDISGDAAGDMLKAWRSTMGLSMDDAERLAAAANHIANNMNTTAADVGQVLQRQGALMRTAGLTAEQSAGFAATLLAGGASPEQAATAAKNIMLSLTKGASASGAEKAALEALGFHDPARLAKAMQAAPEEAIMMVFQRIGKLSDEEQVSVMGQLFGSSAVGAVAPMVGNLEQLAGAFNLVRNEADYLDSLQKEFDAMGSTTANQANKAREAFKNITTEIGASLLPTVNEILGHVAKVAQVFARFASENPAIVGAITKIAAAFIAIKVATVGFGYIFTFIKGGFLAVRGALLAARVGMLLFNAAVLANPIGLIIAAVVALIGAGYMLWKHWDKVSAFFVKAWDVIKDLFLTFHPLGWMMGGFSKLLEFLNQWGIVDYFKEKINGIHEWLSQFSLYNSGVAILQTLTEGIKSVAGKPVEAVKNVLGKVRDFLPFSDAKIGPLSELTYSGMQVMETLSAGIHDAANAPADTMSRALQDAPGQLAISAVGAGRGPLSITINQEVHVTGGGDVYEQARRGASDGVEDLLGQLQRALEREERLSYG